MGITPHLISSFQAPALAIQQNRDRKRRQYIPSYGEPHRAVKIHPSPNTDVHHTLNFHIFFLMVSSLQYHHDERHSNGYKCLISQKLWEKLPPAGVELAA